MSFVTNHYYSEQKAFLTWGVILRNSEIEGHEEFQISTVWVKMRTTVYSVGGWSEPTSSSLPLGMEQRALWALEKQRVDQRWNDAFFLGGNSYRDPDQK